MPFLFCLLFYKRINTKALKAFFYYTIILFIFNVISIFVLAVLGKPTIYFLTSRIFNVLEFASITYFLSLIVNNSLAKKLFLISIVPFTIYAITDYVMGNKNVFNNHSHIVSSFLFILYIIYFFFEKMRRVTATPLYQTRVFWVCVGLLLYFTGSFFFILFINVPKKIDIELVKIMSMVYMFSVVIKNIILCLSLLATNSDGEDNEMLSIPTDILLNEPYLPSTAKN